jgi:hypothetical protein
MSSGCAAWFGGTEERKPSRFAASPAFRARVADGQGRSGVDGGIRVV